MGAHDGSERVVNAEPVCVALNNEMCFEWYTRLRRIDQVSSPCSECLMSGIWVVLKEIL